MFIINLDCCLLHLDMLLKYKSINIDHLIHLSIYNVNSANLLPFHDGTSLFTNIESSLWRLSDTLPLISMIYWHVNEQLMSLCSSINSFYIVIISSKFCGKSIFLNNDLNRLKGQRLKLIMLKKCESELGDCFPFVKQMHIQNNCISINVLFMK